MGNGNPRKYSFRWELLGDIDEGFIAALMEGFSGGNFEVKEVDCWCTGDRTCRFKAEAVG